VADPNTVKKPPFEDEDDDEDEYDGS